MGSRWTEACRHWAALTLSVVAGMVAPAVSAQPPAGGTDSSVDARPNRPEVAPPSEVDAGDGPRAEGPSPDASPSAPDPSPSDASPSVPDAVVPVPAPPGEGADDDVDIISSAGPRRRRPPAYRPSIVIDETPIEWNPKWKKFSLIDYLTTGSFLVASFASIAIPPDPDRWDQRNRFDRAVRDELRLPTIQAQNRARDASDVLLTLSINHLLIDNLVVTWWGYNADTLALEMLLMNIQAFSFNTAMNGLVAALASRQRPFGPDRCVGGDNVNVGDCRSNNQFRSFFSGHASTTFTVAGLICTHHYHLPLYGGGAGDVIACGASVGAAAATATLRVMGDKHWATDVLTGAAIGSFSGLAIPYLFHYGAGSDEDESDKQAKRNDGLAPTIRVTPMPTGLTFHGTF